MSCKHLYVSNYGEYYCETDGRFCRLSGTAGIGDPFPADCEWCEKYSSRAKDPEVVKKFKEFDAKNTSDILRREHDFWEDDEEEIPHSKAYERSVQITIDEQTKVKLGVVINQYYKDLIMMTLDDMYDAKLQKDAGTGTEWIEFETPDHFQAKCVL